MSSLRTRGFTLVELMVALVLLGVISAAVYQALATNQRTFIAQTQRIDLQQNIRAGVTILPGEFRTLDAAEGDIAAMSATSITIRAIRKLGFLCVAPILGGGLGNVTFVVRGQPFFGVGGGFAVNDSLLVFYEGDPTTRTDDSWLPAQVKGIAAAACPDSNGSHPGVQVTMAPQWLTGQVNVPGAITNGSPVYAFATVTYGLFQSSSDSRWYVGQLVPGGTMQPLIGPLIGSNGLTLSYYDTLGAVTAVPAQVAQIGVVLRAQTVVPIRQGYGGTTDYQVDSVSSRVALRNNPRCGPPGGPCL